MDDEGPPLWARLLIAAHLAVIAAAIGGIVAGHWGGALVGLFLATPFIAMTVLAPGVLGAILAVLSLFSCAS